ncbi:MAG: hydantoinase/oxoprolinase family protein [Deltaproteobacteria bacterium]|nr:hydantoinase/oxoprolinase family protein [Deltaproteobacteria bacterium]
MSHAPQADSHYRIGIDVGGTFVDFLLVDGEENRSVYKYPSTPENPALGIEQGLREIARSLALTVEQFLGRLELIVHGTTITTNAILTRTGARTAFVTTKGFRDVLNMRRGLRERQYDSRQSPPSPLVRRRDIYTVGERVDSQGSVLAAVSPGELQELAGELEAGGYQAVGVSTMFSFLNPVNERGIGDTLRERLPEAYVSLSSEILPQARFYERNSTVALNAYVGPILSRYLRRAQQYLLANGFRGTFLIMQSNGGAMSADTSSRFAVNTLFSGPAAGPVAGLFFGRAHGLANLITMDMGGTSFDVCLVRNGRPSITTETEIGGYRMALPALDIHPIGAGGGSVAWVDRAGMLRVGPRSAGASPGPACYGLGGTEATVTDADLVLGFLDPDYFLAGRMRLDPAAAVRAIEENVARRLGLSVEEAARGIYEVVNANMASEVNLVSIAKGYDPRDFPLVVAGGAGPIHAAMIARDQESPLVIVPRNSSVFCASGLLMSDIKHDYVRTYVTEFGGADLGRLERLCAELLAEAVADVEREGLSRRNAEFAFSTDVRYLGQFNELVVSLPVPEDGRLEAQHLEALEASFHRRHRERYGYSLPDAAVELVNVRLRSTGRMKSPTLVPGPRHGADASGALKGQRRAFFEGGFVVAPVYDGLRLHHGNTVLGPAIVEEPTTTIVVHPEFKLVCDRFDNYIMLPRGRLFEEVLEDLKARAQR